MILSYYYGEGKLKEFTKYLVIREIEESFRKPETILNRNSSNLRVLKFIFENEFNEKQKELYDYCLNEIEENKQPITVCCFM